MGDGHENRAAGDNTEARSRGNVAYAEKTQYTRCHKNQSGVAKVIVDGDSRTAVWFPAPKQLSPQSVNGNVEWHPFYGSATTVGRHVRFRQVWQEMKAALCAPTFAMFAACVRRDPHGVHR